MDGGEKGGLTSLILGSNRLTLGVPLTDTISRESSLSISEEFSVTSTADISALPGIMWKSSSSGPDSDSLPQAKRVMATSAEEGRRGLSVFDGLKTIPMSPDALMAEINNAISNLECARATALLDSLSASLLENKCSEGSSVS
ncbi:hypothetical protein FNV43_RR11858 [Rhamnella rubrinervis]|uniref:Uncharacterized protein n=1 Tax=Rhamnella rubrinervis TaxID=2594499 RepID=A0A8K0MI91_9ROSA|nr:hypothetical protein FNV43_RR11858 [Rhamnella rubrinervis]